MPQDCSGAWVLLHHLHITTNNSTTARTFLFFLVERGITATRGEFISCFLQQLFPIAQTRGEKNKAPSSQGSQLLDCIKGHDDYTIWLHGKISLMCTCFHKIHDGPTVLQ